MYTLAVCENKSYSLNVPRHIAIVMDGNGRWADKYHMPKKMGHNKGAKVARQIVKDCKRLGVEYLTLYTFSSENWSRSDEEIKGVMDLLRKYLKSNTDEFAKDDIRVSFIGSRNRLDKDITELMDVVSEQTKGNSFNLVLAIDYGGRDEIKQAANNFAQDIKQDKVVNFEDYLFTSKMPDPDLIIRTSGEKRLSNFLLWQSAYSEMHFTDTLWPDFTEIDLIKAIEDYSQRDRRFGGRK